MPKRRTIPSQLQKRLFQESGSSCCVCGEPDVRTLEIHHIEGDPSEHVEEQMLVLCASCHAKAERGGLSKKDLYEAKHSSRTTLTRPSSEQPPMLRLVGTNNFAAGRDLNVGSLTVRTGQRSVRSPVMPGTVSEHPNMANYLNYLIDRYNEMKKWDCERTGTPMKYPLIRIAYQKEIGCKVKDTPVEQFAAACSFLQRRIDNTTLGRIQRKKGHSNCSAYSDWLEKKGLSSS